MNRIISSLKFASVLAMCMSVASEAYPETVKKSPDWDFNNSVLGDEWRIYGNTNPENCTLTERKGFLRLKASDAPTVVARSKEHTDFQASTRFELVDGGAAGIAACIDNGYRCDVCVKDGKMHFRYIVGDEKYDSVLDDVADGFVEMRIKGSEDRYELYYSIDGKTFKEAGRMDASVFEGGNVSIGLFAEGKGYADFDNFKYREIIPEISPKLYSGNANPLLDFHFTADPTAVEHEGRLYVYATNDHQQYEAVGRDGKNSYEKIKSLVMMSTDDMVNWTYHGLIDVGSIAPWIIASWAPSIVKREESDGKTHFYLYFSNSGFGTGVLTATSPVGPWTSPLDKSLVDAHSPGLGNCKVPFDPGAVIDKDGTGWLSIGAGKSCIMRLGQDMTSIDSEMKELKAPYHFEANELNYINDTYVYTYNTDWQERSDWTENAEIPSICSMSYMTSKTPLDSDSWKYHHHYLKNPGDYGYDYSNNHTHLHKYNGKWYVFYHTMSLQNSFNTDGGFRNVCVDEIEVDEDKLHISMGKQTLSGPSQIKPVNPRDIVRASTTAATHGLKFLQSDVPGNVIATPMEQEALIIVKGVYFSEIPGRFMVNASGKGTVEVREGGPSGELLASVRVDASEPAPHEADVSGRTPGATCDLCFVLKGRGLEFDSWQFK